MSNAELEALVERVRDFASAMGGPLRLYPFDPFDPECARVWLDKSDLSAICAEVERLTGMADAYRTTIADYDKRVGALQDEVERRREEVSVLRMFIGKNEVEEANEELANLDAARTTGGRDA